MPTISSKKNRKQVNLRYHMWSWIHSFIFWKNRRLEKIISTLPDLLVITLILDNENKYIIDYISEPVLKITLKDRTIHSSYKNRRLKIPVKYHAIRLHAMSKSDLWNNFAIKPKQTKHFHTVDSYLAAIQTCLPFLVEKGHNERFYVVVEHLYGVRTIFKKFRL